MQQIRAVTQHSAAVCLENLKQLGSIAAQVHLVWTALTMSMVCPSSAVHKGLADIQYHA